MDKHKLKDTRLHDVDFEVRTLEDEGKTVISGYALKFNKASEDLGFTEYIDRQALTGADMSNVVALLNHDSNYVLGRSGRNLTLSVDDTGLFFEIEPNDTSYVRDLMENMRSGLIDKCSFAFSIAKGGDEWRELKDGRYERTVKQIDKLYDVSVVTSPAYEDTVALLSQRSADSFEAESSKKTVERLEELRQMEIELMDADLGIELSNTESN